MSDAYQSAPSINTVTSPEQTAAVEANAPEETPAPDKISVFKKNQMPMQRIMAAVMRSAAAVQGQEQAKKVASSQQASNARMSVTMKPNPDGGAPLVTVKDAPADLLNHTQQDDLNKSYNTPREQVESKIATTPPPADHPLEQAATALEKNGASVLRPWDPKIRESVKSEEALTAIGVQLGIPDAKANAHRAWKQIKSGAVSADVVVQRLAGFATSKLEQDSHNLQATLAPYAAETERAQTNLEQKETRDRLQRQLTDAEREKVLKHKAEIIKNLPLVDADELRATLESQNTSGVPFTDFEVHGAEYDQKQKINKAFLDYTDTKKDTLALGYQPTWEDAKKAFGYPLTKNQDTIGEARWKSAHAYVQKQDEIEAMRRQRSDDQHEIVMLRLQNASVDKPARISPSDADLMSASEISELDPVKVKDFDGLLRHKEGRLRKQLEDEQDRYGKAHSQAVAIQSKGMQQFGDEEQLAGYKADATNAGRRIDELKSELAAIAAKRAERGNPAVRNKVGPQIGEKKKFTSGPSAGKVGVWNGSAYVVP
jgi:hypothetical protein